MSTMPVAALLASWLDAVHGGLAGPDDLAHAVRGEDPRHLVVGLTGRTGELDPGAATVTETDAVDLEQAPRRLRGPVSLALPVPGDPVGLGGPTPFNVAALEAGQAVVAGPVGLVPVEDARTIVWHAYDADPVPWVDERETAIVLRTTLAEVTQRLVDLDVVSWQPEIPDLLMNLRDRHPLALPPGLGPRRVETAERAVLCLEIVALARGEEGGSVSAGEMHRRRSALDDLDRAARHALVGACSGQHGVG